MDPCRSPWPHDRRRFALSTRPPVKPSSNTISTRLGFRDCLRHNGMRHRHQNTPLGIHPGRPLDRRLASNRHRLWHPKNRRRPGPLSKRSIPRRHRLPGNPSLQIQLLQLATPSPWPNLYARQRRPRPPRRTRPRPHQRPGHRPLPHPPPRPRLHHPPRHLPNPTRRPRHHPHPPPAPPAMAHPLRPHPLGHHPRHAERPHLEQVTYWQAPATYEQLFITQYIHHIDQEIAWSSRLGLSTSYVSSAGRCRGREAIRPPRSLSPRHRPVAIIPPLGRPLRWVCHAFGIFVRPGDKVQHLLIPLQVGPLPLGRGTAGHISRPTTAIQIHPAIILDHTGGAATQSVMSGPLNPHPTTNPPPPSARPASS